MTSRTAGTDRGASELLLLLARERPRFLSFLQRRVNSTDADDLLQQALLRAAEYLHTLQDGERVEAWFFRIVRHVLANHLAHQATQRTRLATLAAQASEQELEEVTFCACSLGVLQRLRPSYREVVQRVHLDEEPIEAVAASLGISTNNVKVRLHRARKALSESLLAQCGTSSVRACQGCGCEDGLSSAKGS